MVKRQEAVLEPEFRKDPGEEEFLERLNDLLGPAQEEEYRDLPEAFPTLHIVGVPRSGTTLIYQLLASHLDVGYVNNLIACFWRSPVYGIRLSRKVLSRSWRSSLSSSFGRTDGPQEPHEFGYFWSSQLGYPSLAQRPPEFEDGIDWLRLRRVLLNMAHAFGRPMMFKPFLLTWHLQRMKEVMPRTVFVHVRRDPVDTALSLVRLRRRVLGSADRWASLRPLEADELEHEPYWWQVAGQVFHLERAITEQLDRLSPSCVVEIDYEELCADPSGALEQVRELFRRNGAEVALLGGPPATLEPSVPSAESAAEAEAVRRAVRVFFGERDVGTAAS
jgi:hypothetical protein